MDHKKCPNSRSSFVRNHFFMVFYGHTPLLSFSVANICANLAHPRVPLAKGKRILPIIEKKRVPLFNALFLRTPMLQAKTSRTSGPQLVFHFFPVRTTRTAGKAPFSYVIIWNQNNRRNRSLTKNNRKRNSNEKKGDNNSQKKTKQKRTRKTKKETPKPENNIIQHEE